MRTLGSEGLQRFRLLQNEAVNAVTERLYATHGSIYEQFGTRGRAACREDLAFHLEFLQPVLEFGLLQPMVDYLCWLGSVLAARAIPADHIARSLDLLGEFFAEHMDAADAGAVTAALQAARTQFMNAEARETRSTAGTADPWPEATPFEAALLAGSSTRGIGGREPLYRQWPQPRRYRAARYPAFTVPYRRGMADKPRVGRKGAHGDRPCAVGDDRGSAAFASAGDDRQAGAAGLRRRQPSHRRSSHGGRCISTRRLGRAVSRCGCAHRGDHPAGRRVERRIWWDCRWPSHTSCRLPRRSIAQLAERFGSARPAVIIGGLAINRFSRLADMVGADVVQR